nr:uncharacterized protein LOC108123991 [Drosophila bipectinata]
MPQSTLYVVLIIIILTPNVLATINYEIFSDSNYPGKCVINTEHDQKIIGDGDVIPHPAKCGRIECGRDGWALVYTCSEDKIVPSGCEYKSVDTGLYYPACCRAPLVCNEI